MQNSCEIPYIFTSHEYSSVILYLVIISRFHVCCETPSVYKIKSKAVLELELGLIENRKGEKLEAKKLKNERGRSTHEESDKWYFTISHYCYTCKGESML